MINRLSALRSVVIAMTAVPVPGSTAMAQEPLATGHEEVHEEDSFSPYANRNFPSQVFWGDTHVHTSISMDAGAIGNRLGPDQAYRFARGEEVTSSSGIKEALRYGIEMADEVPMTTQERAYTSPIWYTP